MLSRYLDVARIDSLLSCESTSALPIVKYLLYLLLCFVLIFSFVSLIFSRVASFSLSYDFSASSFSFSLRFVSFVVFFYFFIYLFERSLLLYNFPFDARCALSSVLSIVCSWSGVRVTIFWDGFCNLLRQMPRPRLRQLLTR